MKYFLLNGLVSIDMTQRSTWNIMNYFITLDSELK